MTDSAKIRRSVSPRRIFLCPRHRSLGAARTSWVGLAHLEDMSDIEHIIPGLDPVLTTSELAGHLGVPVQTIHDLRHAGGVPAASGSAGNCATDSPKSASGSPRSRRQPSGDPLPTETTGERRTRPAPKLCTDSGALAPTRRFDSAATSARLLSSGSTCRATSTWRSSRTASGRRSTPSGPCRWLDTPAVRWCHGGTTALYAESRRTTAGAADSTG